MVKSQVFNWKDLGLRVLDNQLRVGRVFRIEIVFTNPLVRCFHSRKSFSLSFTIKAVALTDCTISVEAAQLVRAREANYPPIGPGEKVKLYIPHFDHLLLLLPIDHHPDRTHVELRQINIVL